jgi:deoxyribonuclease-4
MALSNAGSGYRQDVLIGAHVKGGGKLVGALKEANLIGAEVVQIFTQSPRAWKPTQYAPEVLEGYVQAVEKDPLVVATYTHATYLINLATSDPELLAKSEEALCANLAATSGMGAKGLILHIGSHRGAGLTGVLPQIAEALVGALDTVVNPLTGGKPAPILIENAAGAGGTVGRSLEELALLYEAAGNDPRLGLCIDTQHLWASGVAYTTIEKADTLIKNIKKTVGLERLQAFHLNDSKVEFGANKDRHANIGEGTIGAKGLGALLSHPALKYVPAILEVPGDGGGPRASDVEAARKALAVGQKARAKK